MNSIDRLPGTRLPFNRQTITAMPYCQRRLAVARLLWVGAHPEKPGVAGLQPAHSQERLVSLGGVLTPLADAFLNGIAPHTVIEMLRYKGITVHERHILPVELEGFEHCWLAGTQSR